MGKSLIIVESPAKARTISKFAGKKYTVKASMGHIRDLPKSQFGVDLEHNFEPKYITIRGKGQILKELKDAAKAADKVFLASDPDREGEAISWHLAKSLGIDPSSSCRIEFNEITKGAIQRALKNPRPINLAKVNAQQARRILDRIVGYKLSPLLWRKIKKGLSAGRVQSVAVKLICDREKEIQNFKIEEYWSLRAFLQGSKKNDLFWAKLVKKGSQKIELKSEQEIRAVIEDLKGKKFFVYSIEEKERLRNPSPPFTTSSLQQEASRKLNFTPKKTMKLAQELYEGLSVGKEGTIGLITYIRTDSTRIAESVQEEAKNYILTKYGKEYLPKQPRKYKEKKGAQDAHEAIRPTGVEREPDLIKEYLTKDQYKLYKLIWERFIASQMSSAVLNVLTVEVKAGDYLFKASGSNLKFPGFTVVYEETLDEKKEEDENKSLPKLEQNQELELKELDPKQHFTQPPPRYSEAMLIKVLEEKGIGRPSTYVPIIETIQQRGYVVKEDRRFKPTELGFMVVDMLSKYFPKIIDEEFTAEMEGNLDRVEEGNDDWVKVLADFYKPFAESLKLAEEKIKEVVIPDEVTDELCEKCGRNLVVKHGRYGKFLACPGFPECRYTKPIIQGIGVLCPKCSSEIVERKSKKGKKFYGCMRYPDCDFVSWDKPVQQLCPNCGHLLVEKRSRGGDFKIICNNPDCGEQKTVD
ncbi:MAG TPA: type I DNA topoisomerase [Clostridia bacterium]|nr:type I DNA topoisomerase [Clostridia bacterium]